jgi:hypothetical protein
VSTSTQSDIGLCVSDVVDRCMAIDRVVEEVEVLTYLPSESQHPYHKAIRKDSKENSRK